MSVSRLEVIRTKRKGRCVWIVSYDTDDYPSKKKRVILSTRKMAVERIKRVM